MVQRPSVPVHHSYVATGSSADRIRHWETYNAKALVAVQCAVPPAAPLQASQTNLDLSRLQLATITGSPHRVSRPAELIEQCPTGSIAVYLMLGAAGTFESNGQRRVIRSGELLVCDADQPFDRELGHGVSEFAVKVRRSQLRETLGVEVGSTPALVDPGANLAAHALTRTAVTVVRTDDASVDELATLELVGLLAAGDATPPDVRHRVAARTYIEEHLPDRGLSVARIAAATGISERQLSRIFATTGVSVPQYVLGRRLELARGILLRHSTVPVAEAARAAGLGSKGHFSQAFQDRFGVTAGEMRRGAAS